MTALEIIAAVESQLDDLAAQSDVPTAYLFARALCRYAPPPYRLPGEVLETLMEVVIAHHTAVASFTGVRNALHIAAKARQMAIEDRIKGNVQSAKWWEAVSDNELNHARVLAA